MTAQTASRRADLQLAEPWGGTGWVTDLGGPVHWVDYGGPDQSDDPTAGVPIVMVHGLGGSHLNWVGIAPKIATRHHVYAIDQAGFGLTPGANRSTSVHAKREGLADLGRLADHVTGLDGLAGLAAVHPRRGRGTHRHRGHRHRAGGGTDAGAAACGTCPR